MLGINRTKDICACSVHVRISIYYITYVELISKDAEYENVN